jgi:hypothetical protein
MSNGKRKRGASFEEVEVSGSENEEEVSGSEAEEEVSELVTALVKSLKKTKRTSATALVKSLKKTMKNMAKQIKDLEGNLEKKIDSSFNDLERKIDDLDLPDLSDLEQKIDDLEKKSKLVETPALAPPAKSKKKGGAEACWQTAAGGSWQSAGSAADWRVCANVDCEQRLTLNPTQEKFGCPKCLNIFMVATGKRIGKLDRNAQEVEETREEKLAASVRIGGKSITCPSVTSR